MVDIVVNGSARSLEMEAQTPRIEVHVIQSGGEIGDAGEAGLHSAAPAVANAVYAATGRRLRALPLRLST